ncbi:RelA/SpoT domain-containing protein [Paraburkholderia sp. EG286A]|uniref:RelA/SpoT domain-containing protein n=1 Tax=Paraburkholderia sp. EG286A TaxID=3237014 RepID=UPI0034D26FEE
MYQKTEAEFREQNRITDAEWEIAKLDWNTLSAIGSRHNSQKNALARAAEAMARDLQSIDRVHSVRFRVKDTDHLLAKIIRKRVEGGEKYAEIGVENYQAIITDLVGVRALHLFKEDLFRIDKSIRDAWEQEENPPVAYVRQGDSGEKLKDAGFDVKDHKAGYRSVHYIVSTSPRRQKILAEIQVRTIFEEGWAEIDHAVKYPNFSDDESVAEFLGIFNRLAGAADEMGSFVRRMTESVRTVNAIVNRDDDALQRSLRDALNPVDVSDGELNKFATFLSLTDSLSKNPYRRKRKAMDDAFRIYDPTDKTRGDFVSFTISDGDQTVPGRISRTALAILRSPNDGDDLATFEAQKEKIRAAAFNMRRLNPSLDLIALGSNNFS